MLHAIDTLKATIEEKKFAKGDSEEDVWQWSEETDEHVMRADEVIKSIDLQSKAIDLKEQELQEIEKHNQNMKFEKELLEQKAEFEKMREKEMATACADKQSKSKSVAKPPKLTITKFSGRFEDWLPFWGKFTAEIDSTELSTLTKP